MELFEKYEAIAYFDAIIKQINTDIERLSNADIMETDTVELISYYLHKYQIEKLIIYKDNITKDIREEQIKRYNSSFSREYGYGDPEYYTLDGYVITFTIPFDGDVELLHLKPSTFFMSRFEVKDVIKPTESKCGEFLFTMSFEKNELLGQDDSAALVQNRFDNEIRYYYEMINNINNNVDEFNSKLDNVIQQGIEKRKQKASDYLSLREKLSLPLELDDRAPNIRPIPLEKKYIKRMTEFPKKKTRNKEYTISDEAYMNIINIIRLSCISMEKTASTFAKLYEEELRDILLSNLNSHYKSTATGETFNKSGKTDILIPFDNKAAYIAECKIWHGNKAFEEAINQLCGYTTWRDIKTSLIVFNKENSNFNSILKTIDNSLRENVMCKNFSKEEQNEWQGTFTKEIGSNDLLTINVMAFDLYVKV